jgi:hypothetical protein
MLFCGSVFLDVLFIELINPHPHDRHRWKLDLMRSDPFMNSLSSFCHIFRDEVKSSDIAISTLPPRETLIHTPSQMWGSASGFQMDGESGHSLIQSLDHLLPLPFPIISASFLNASVF